MCNSFRSWLPYYGYQQPPLKHTHTHKKRILKPEQSNCVCMCVFMSVILHLCIQHACGLRLCVRAGIPSSNWVQPFNVSQALLVRAIHDARRLRLLLFHVLSVHFTSLALQSSLWFETCQCIFRPFYPPLVPQCCSTSCWHNLCLPPLSSDWHVVGLTVALCSWNLMRCLLFPSLFHSEGYFSVLLRVAGTRRRA